MLRSTLWKHPIHDPCTVVLSDVIRCTCRFSFRPCQKLSHGKLPDCIGYRASSPKATFQNLAKVQRIEDTTNGIKVIWDNGKYRTFRLEWLFRNRPEVLLSCGQNSSNPLDSPSSNSKFAAHVCDEGRAVRIVWDEHSQSIYDSNWLSRFAQKDVMEGRTSSALIPVPLRSRSEIIPSVSFNDLASDHGVLSWLETLNRDGVCIVHGVPRATAAVLELARRIGPIMHTIYGEVRV